MEGQRSGPCFLEREAELQATAETTGSEFLWFWEITDPTVVLGRSGNLEAEVKTCACESDAVPVLRRRSGGGSVLLAYGCLNYTLILNLEQRPALQDVHLSYKLILQSFIRAISKPNIVTVGGDLTSTGKKFGGCSQKRSRTTLLHHGTILYDFDLGLVSRYLHEPRKAPAYREGRSHSEFLTNIALDASFQARLTTEYPNVKVMK